MEEASARMARKARPEDLLNIDIFFDLVPVAGRAELARSLRKQAIQAAADSPAFLSLLAESVQRVAARLSFFGRLPVEEGRLDLKRDGLLPLVSLARTLALSVGSTARTTSERLRAAAAFGNLPDGDSEALVRLHQQLLSWVLRQQLLDLEEGLRPSGRVEGRRLASSERKDLTAGLKRLNAIVGELQGLMVR